MVLEVVSKSLGALAVVLTLLPIVRSTKGWIRIWEFPRLQIGILALAAVVLMLVSTDGLGLLEGALVAAVAACAAWQFSFVWRFSPLAPTVVALSRLDASSPRCLSLVTTNVKRDARDSDALLQIIHDAEPDVVLAVEVDEWWSERLQAGLGTRYPNQLIYPLSNGYGLALFSRLELVDAAIRFVVDEAIPSIKAGIRLRCGAPVDIYGVHPKPPGPLQDSTERDVELISVGREIALTGLPSIVVGDLNDVAWSHTTQRFKDIGRLLDPRSGRGLFNTFPAGLPGLRYPLDHVFHTQHFDLGELRVLPRFESDHLPLKATLCLRDRTPV